jgi:formylglycine-generating enzyme
MLRNIIIVSLIVGSSLACDHLKHEDAPPTPPVHSEAENLKHPELEPELALIPACNCYIGSDSAADERPVHQVSLDAYYIGKFEVTNAQYKTFCDETGRKYPEARWTHHSHDSSASYLVDKPSYPVVDVNWDDAVAYCKWLSSKTNKKYRLPTEAEWEHASRGGLENKMYPWGDEPYDSGNFRANCGAEADNDRARGKDGFLYTAPVGSFAPNGYGLFDTAGNVWEWCSDVYDEHYYSRSPENNPENSEGSDKHVIRGGSWFGGPDKLRCSARLWNYASIRYASTGFRVAMTP